MDDLPIVRKRVLSDKYLFYIMSKQIDLIKSHTKLENNSKIIEIGAAGGITDYLWKQVITTDIRSCDGVQIVCDAHALPFEENSVDLIFGIDTLHHLENPEVFFRKLSDKLRKNGKAIFIDPNFNWFSILMFKKILKKIHKEPYDTKVNNWKLPNDSYLIGNQAALYNIFVRDVDKFKNLFPHLKFSFGEESRGLSFLISGGVSTRLPISSNVLIKLDKFESSSKKWMKLFGMSRLVILEKI